ncbi:alpha/beta fold hydrolase [Streptomyces sp. NPDC058299]|uniref:alpha/beta fold hydrolase n=1 Tax=Streptomyces sp. NPDC058299 TaxID=3346435 RepID=UPI0036F1441D
MSGGRIVYQDRQRVSAVYEATTRLIDVATGDQTVIQSFRARMETSLGGMARTRLPKELIARWYQPLLTDRHIWRDFARFLRSTRRDCYLEAARNFPAFTRPVLVAWGAEDRMMPPETGRRLARLLPDARYVEIPDARTLVQLDNPGALIAEIRDFVRAHPLPGEH